MEETRKLANLVNDIKYENLPEDVIRRAKEYLLDYIGVCLFSSEKEWSKIVINFVESLKAKKESTIISRSLKTCSPFAALANGTMGHGFELDDVHEGSLSHPGSVVIPAALAMGEREGIDGRLLITSIVVGYEIMARVGMPIATSTILRGFHPTGTAGTFASASVAAKILRLPVKQIVNAFGIAGSFASGLMEFSQSGGEIKRVHAGKAAENGIMATLLAQNGLTGPATVLEGKYGYFKAFSDNYDLNSAIPKTSVDFEIRNISLKPFACCRSLHAIIDGIKFLQENYDIKTNDIKTIGIGGHEKLVAQHAIYKPESIMEAQYSVPFVTSLAIMGKIDDPRNFKKLALKDQKILDLCKKVSSYKEPNIDRLFPQKCGAKVVVTLSNDKTYEKTVLDPKGGTENPLTKDEVLKKFRNLSTNIFPDSRIEKIIDSVEKLEKSENISTLCKLLRV